MSAHTPGPWTTDGVAARGEWIVVLGPSGERLATMYETDFDGNETSNARLIAAAPDLLAALKAMFANACDCGPDVHCRSCELGLRAIAKAEGKS